MGITSPKIILLAILALIVTLSLSLFNQSSELAGTEDCGKTSEWLNVCPVNFAPGGGGGPGYIRGGLVALGIKL
jgi:hypothetical protein